LIKSLLENLVALGVLFLFKNQLKRITKISLYTVNIFTAQAVNTIDVVNYGFSRNANNCSSPGEKVYRLSQI
jgi:hypothetical protein